MAKTDRILWKCKEETTFHHLTNILDWPKGATHTTVANLIAKKLLKKTGYGVYKTTPEGIKKSKKVLAREPNSSKYIDMVVNRVAALLTVESQYHSVTLLKIEKAIWNPPTETEPLRRELRDIYTKSVHPEHHSDYHLVISQWRDHRKPSCSVCKFDFGKSYKSNARLVKEFAGPGKLYRKLRWESFPDIEKYKKNFNLNTEYTEPIMPDGWD